MTEVPLTPAPGDEAGPGTPGPGETTCPGCNGTGLVGDRPCPTCEGSGRVIEAVGGGVKPGDSLVVHAAYLGDDLRTLSFAGVPSHHLTWAQADFRCGVF